MDLTPASIASATLISSILYVQRNTTGSEFEELATWLAMSCSKTAVATLLRVSWNSIGPIISRMKEELDPDPAKRFKGLVISVGVDETSYKKGHMYITVVINHDTGFRAT